MFSPGWFMVAEIEGKPVAMAISVLDINATLAKMKGRLLPFGWFHYLRRFHNTDTVRVGFLGVLAMIPSAMAAGRLALRRAPVLATLGTGLTVAAFVGLAFGATDGATLAVASTGGDVAVLESLNAQGPVTAGIILYVLGHITGMVLLGIALWRSRAVPAWVGIALAVSQPLHLVFAVIVPSRVGDTLAWGAAAVAFTYCAVRILRTPDAEWDLAPVS